MTGDIRARTDFPAEADAAHNFGVDADGSAERRASKARSDVRQIAVAVPL